MEEKKLYEWLKSDNPLTREMFDDFKFLTRKLPPSDLLMFFKKVINEVAKQNISLTIIDLLQIKTFSLETFQDFGEPKDLDYTLDLILHTLRLIDQRQSFPHNVNEVYLLVKDLADFICDYLQNNIEYLKKINLLFDNCPGRTAIVKKTPEEAFINLRGNDYKVYGFYKGYSLVKQDEIGWREFVKHYEDGIYAKGKVCMIEIISKKTDRYGYVNIVYGKNIKYNGKSFPFEWKKDENNYLITPDGAPVDSCEGRKSPIPCNLSRKEFWWCYGRKCFKANQIDHALTEWEKYSLRDFIKILKLPFDEVGYYIFVSEINRLNRLLNRIRCTDCQHILKPSKQTYFGFYRVAHFYCNNDDHYGTKCPSFHEEIYLTHCLNSKCINVIDSRVAKRCPNGFIICDICGSCCSNEQFVRRKQTLEINGQSVKQKLLDLINNKAGHWEKAECYCYKCGKEMIEDKGGDFTCKECNIHYSRYNVYIRFVYGFRKTRDEKRKNEQANT